MRTSTSSQARVAVRVVTVMAAALVAFVLTAPPSGAQQDPYSDPYSECVSVEAGGAANRAQTDPYSECPPGTEPKLITQPSEPEDEVLGTRILPFTGATVLGFALVGLGAVGVGILLARRRRSGDPA